MKTKLILLLLSLGLMFSCKKKNEDPTDPTNINEVELITTVKIILTDGASNESVFVFRDVDGEGGNEPTDLDTIRVAPNQTYEGEILLLDESKNPVDTISYEVLEEADEHQFFFSSVGGLSASYEAGDEDQNGVPLGMYPDFTTNSSTGIGSFTLTLKHQGEDKPDSGSGNINIGDTDVEVTFPVKIQ